MRFVIYFVFLAGWIGLWWWSYVYHIKACGTDVESVLDVKVQYVQNTRLPLSFKWSDATPILSVQFVRWRDSIIHALSEDQILEVTGISYRDESPVETHLNLGMQRAKAITHVFSPNLLAARIQERANIGEITSDIKNRNFPGYRLRTLTQNASLREQAECTLIYFPFDSTTQVENAAISDYVTDLHEYLSKSRESVKLLTLAAQQNPDSANDRLTLWRMSALKELFLKAGIPADKVILQEKGEQVSSQCIPEDKRSDMKDWIALIFIK